MSAQMKQVFNLRTFFSFIKKIDNKHLYKIEPSSKNILHNIHISWLNSIHSKSQSNFPVYLKKEKDHAGVKNTLCYGFIEKTFDLYPEMIVFYEDECNIKNESVLKLMLTVPKQDIMQYFFQWQRYRKYWWSSTTTTPSLFAVKDMTHGPSTIDTQIVAKFHDNEIIVENVSISTVKNLSEHTAILTCSMSLETALCTLLLDGVLNKTTNGYLRLHNKMAPYKISFALNCQDSNNQQILEQLATLIYSKLNARHISTLLSNFSLPLQAQIEENLERGVTYTAILSDDSLKNGIFQLLNSSTMLKEQVHLSDFEDYASLICSK